LQSEPDPISAWLLGNMRMMVDIMDTYHLPLLLAWLNEIRSTERNINSLVTKEMEITIQKPHRPISILFHNDGYTKEPGI